MDRERRMVERRIKSREVPGREEPRQLRLRRAPVLEQGAGAWSWRARSTSSGGRTSSRSATSGTGKTHIGFGLGLAACQKGLSVGFTTAAALVHELMEARDEKRLLRLQRQLAAYKLLIIDELGYVPLSQTGAELLFEVFSQRYERGSTMVTSNLPFDEWTCVRLRAPDRRAARPADPPRPHPRDERRQLPAQTEQAARSRSRGRRHAAGDIHQA